MSQLAELWSEMYGGPSKTAARRVKELDPVLLHSDRLSQDEKTELLKEHLESRAAQEVPSHARAMVPSSLVGALLGGGGGALIGKSLGAGLKKGGLVGSGIGAALGALVGASSRRAVQDDVHDAKDQLAAGKHSRALAQILAHLDAQKRQEELDREDELEESRREHERQQLDTKARAFTGAAGALSGGLRHFAKGDGSKDY